MTVVAFVAFLVSGLAALLYQVIWQRLLTLFSGADIYSATIVVAVFMAGLGVGSLVGGHIADRVSRRTSLLLFCGAELAIAAFGSISGTLFHDVLYERLGTWALSPPAIAATIFVSLLLPTACMGASLPLLSRAITAHLGDAAPRIGSLYGFNTLGAALGAFGGTWVLVPMRGLDGSLNIAVMANVVCALALLPMGFAWRDTGDVGVVEAPSARPAQAAQTGYPFSLWVVLFACSGFIALSLEVAWFRMLGVMMKSTAFTFGTLLTLYLAGLGIGSLAGSVVAGRLRRPARAFLLLQAGVGLSTGLLVVGLMVAASRYEPLLAYFGEYEHLDVKHYAVSLKNWLLEGEPLADMGLFPLIYLGLPALLVLLPTSLMGCAFPVLQRLVHADLDRLGRRIGTLLVANIAGSAAGAIVTGLFLMGAVGTAGTLKILVAAGAGFLVLGLGLPATRASGSTRWFVPVAAAAVVFVPLVMVMPNAATLWSRLHGTDEAHLLFGEDGAGLSSIKTRHAGEDRPVVFVNGLGESYMPYGGLHTALAAVPALMHGSPKSAAVIGLGSGDTVHGIAGHPAIERVAAIEIVRRQLETLRALDRQHDDPALAAMLADRRIEHVFADGRSYLMRSRERFDIIEADALRPTSAYSGNLYSQEYFTLVRSRLATRGLAVTWRASDRVYNTFVRVFPHVVVLREMLIGSNEPIPVDRAAIDAQLARHEVSTYYRRAGIDIVDLVDSSLEDLKVLGPDDPREGRADVNTDLDPQDEFDLDLR